MITSKHEPLRPGQFVRYRGKRWWISAIEWGASEHSFDKLLKVKLQRDLPDGTMNVVYIAGGELHEIR